MAKQKFNYLDDSDDVEIEDLSDSNE